MSEVMGAEKENASSQTRRSRLALELSDAAVEELETLERVTGLKKGDLARFALIALGVIVRSKQRGEEIHLVNPQHPERPRVLELPVPIRSTESNC